MLWLTLFLQYLGRRGPSTVVRSGKVVAIVPCHYFIPLLYFTALLHYFIAILYYISYLEERL